MNTIHPREISLYLGNSPEVVDPDRRLSENAEESRSRRQDLQDRVTLSSRREQTRPHTPRARVFTASLGPEYLLTYDGHGEGVTPSQDEWPRERRVDLFA